MLSKQFSRCLVVFIALLLFSGTSEAATVTSTTTGGNWNNTATWVGGAVPLSTDNAVIASGATVTLNVAGISIVNLTITGTLTGTNPITVTGSYTNNGTHSGTGGITLSGAGSTIDGAGSISTSGTLTISASKTIAATANLSISSTIALSGTITVSNSGTITSTSATGITGSVAGSTWANLANSTLKVAGALLTTGTLTATASPNTVFYTSTTAAQTIKAATYHHLTIDKSTRIATFGASSTINGNLTVQSGILSVTGITLTVNGTTSISGRLTDSLSTTGTKTFVGLVTINGGGSWANPTGESNVFRGGITNNGSFHAGTAGTCTFNTNSQALSGSGSFTFFTLAISGAITVTNSATVTVANNMTGTVTQSTWVNDVNATLNAGRAVLSTGTLTATAAPNTVNYNRANNQNIKATTYHHLLLSNTSAKTALGGLTVNGNFTVSGTASFIAGTSFTHTFYGNWIINTSTSPWFSFTTSSTVNFNTPSPVAAATSISGTNTATIAFNILNVNNTSGFSTAKNITATGNMTVAGGVVFTPGATNTIGGTGTITGAGTVQVTRVAATADYLSQYTINNRTLTDLTVEYAAANQVLSALSYGGLKVSGSISGTTNSVSVGKALTVTSSGTLTAAATSTITMNDGSSIVNSGILRFYNLAISANAAVTSSSSFNVGGTLTVNSSGSLGPAPNVSITGTSIVNNGSLTFGDLSDSGTVITSSSFTVTGNLAVTGSLTATAGTITLSGSSKSITGSGTKSFFALNVTGTITTAQNFSLGSNFSIDPAASFTASAGTVTINATTLLTGTANLFNLTLAGSSATFRHNTYAVTGIAGTVTLNGGTLDCFTNTPNTVIYNGTGAQTILSMTYYHLSTASGGTKSIGGNILVNGDLTIGSGTTLEGGTGTTHTIVGNWMNNGTFTASTSAVQFTGTENVSITGPTIFHALTLNKASSNDLLTLNNNVQADTVNVTNGEIITGTTNTMTITSSRSGNGIILGNITRTHSFGNGTAYAFEGPDNTITFASGAANVTSITLTVVSDAVSDFPLNGSINRSYTISVSSSNSYTATLRLHYLDAELNGNTESLMKLWRYSTTWSVSGKTASDSSANWIEQGSLTDLNGRWTLSDDANIIRWTGGVNTLWETAGNWTVIQGAPSYPPSSADIVELGMVATSNQPTINSSGNARSITFGSAVPVTLSIGSGGSLTTVGNISGTWSAGAQHTIDVGSQSLNVGGSLILSDGTNGHAINLSYSTGTIGIQGSLSESGGANISCTGTGNMNLGGDFQYTSGTFSAGNGTVTYNGTGSQMVAGTISYYNLAFNKSSGTATLSASGTVNNALSLSGSGTFALSAPLSVGGSVSLNTGTTLNCGSQTLSVGGDWVNSGTFTPGTGTVSFNGSGSQTISTTTFNTFSVNKASGTASLSGNVLLNSDCNLTAGTLDIGSYTLNRNTAGGSFTIGASGILKIGGANNFPSNFSTISISSSGTTEYNGTGTQSISPVTYGNLTFSNGASNAKNLTGSPIVAGDLLINTGATLNGNGSTLTLHGNWTKNGSFSASTGTVVLAGSGKGISGSTSFNTLTVNGSYTAASDVTVTGTLTNSGTFAAGSTTLTISGNLANTGSLTSSGSVTFTGTSPQNIALNAGFVSTGTVNFNGSVAPSGSGLTSPTFYNLNINNTAGISPVTNWTIGGTFTVANGSAFYGGALSHTFQGTVTNSGTLTSSGILTFSPNTDVILTLKGTSFSSTGVVNFDGVGKITLTAIPLTFASLMITNTSSTGVTPLAAWTITNDLTIERDATLHGGTGLSHLVSGDIANEGTLEGGTSTITMNNATGANIQGNGSTTFNNLTISGTITALSNIAMTGNFVNNGTFDATGVVVAFTGTGASSITGTTNPTTIDQLQISKSSAATTIGVALNGMSLLDIESGTLTLGTFSITKSGTGSDSLIIRPDAKLQIAGASNFPVFDDYLFERSSLVEYNGTVGQTISALPLYGDLLLSNTGTKTISTSISVNGIVTVNSAVPVTVTPAGVLSVGENFNNAGILTNRGTILVGP